MSQQTFVVKPQGGLQTTSDIAEWGLERDRSCEATAALGADRACLRHGAAANAQARRYL
jgi:hypothetical protein